MMFGNRESVTTAELVVAVFSGLDLLGGQGPNHVDDFPTRQLLDLVFWNAVLTQDCSRVFERQLTQVCVGSGDCAFRLLFYLFLVGRLVRDADIGETLAGFSSRISRT